jgi:hypothetical protein
MPLLSSSKRSVSNILTTRDVLHRADPVDQQEPGKASERNASKAAPQEELPTLQDLPAITADLSRALHELQHSVAQLHASQDLQESQAISAVPLRTRQESDPTPKPLADSKQISSKELHHLFGNLSQLVSLPKGTKRKPESALESTTSKRAREHTKSKQPQWATPQASKHSQPDFSQRNADDMGGVRPEHNSAGTHEHPLLVEAPEHNSVIIQVPASLPVISSSKSSPKLPSPVTRELKSKAWDTSQRLKSLEDDEYFFLLSRVACELENKLDRGRNTSRIRRNTEAPDMLDDMKLGLSSMASNEPREEFYEFTAQQWQIWRVLERAVDKKRDRMLAGYE